MLHLPGTSRFWKQIIQDLLFNNYFVRLNTTFVLFELSKLYSDDGEKSLNVIEEAVSYLTKKVDSKTRDVKVLQPTIATQTVTLYSMSLHVVLQKFRIDCSNFVSNYLVFQAVKTEANTLYEMDKATQVTDYIIPDIYIKEIS